MGFGENMRVSTAYIILRRVLRADVGDARASAALSGGLAPIYSDSFATLDVRFACLVHLKFARDHA